MSNENIRGKRPLPHEQKQAHSPPTRILTDGGRTTIDTLAFVDRETGSHVAYDGPFACRREGTSVEISIPLGDTEARITHQTAANLTDRVGDIAVTTWATGVDTTGHIEAADIIEDVLTVQIDDGNTVGPEAITSDTEGGEVDG